MDYIQVAYQRDFNMKVKEAIDHLERMEWPNSTVDFDDQMQFLFYSNSTIISHVGVILKQTIINKKRYKVAGICGVVTHPNYRGKGYALKLLEKAVIYMIENQADFSVFTCHQDLVNFYEKAGWRSTKNALIGGTSEHPMSSNQYDVCTMMKMLSADAKEDAQLIQQDIILELGVGRLW